MSRQPHVRRAAWRSTAIGRTSQSRLHFAGPRRFEPLEARTLLTVAPGTIELTPQEERAAYQAALVDFDGPDLVGKDGPAVKIGMDLNILFQEQKIAASHGAPDNFAPSNDLLMLRNGGVFVDVVGVGDPAGFQTALTGIGMQVVGTAGQLVSGLLPITSIDELAALGNLRFARPSYRPHTSVGSVDSQGDAAMLTDDARTQFGVDGTGIKIGVLSDSFDTGLIGSASTDVGTGDLPVVDVLAEGPDLSTDEGRGMLQLIHDVAPGADLAFASAYPTEAAFAADIRALAAAGSDVIVDDVGYFAEPFFQDGIVAQAVNEVVGQGVAYFSSAGNGDDAAYQQTFIDSGINSSFGGGRLHDFNTGNAIDTLQKFTVQLGEQAIIILQWDQPYGSLGGAGSTNDLDLFAIGSDNKTVVVNARTLNVGGDPLEILFLFNDGTIDVDNNSIPDTEFNLAIELADGVAPGVLKYIHLGGTIEEYATGSAASWGHSNATGAMGVAASAFFRTPAFGEDPPLLNDFSSLGGTPYFFDTAGARLETTQFRTSPGVTGPDGANTTFFGQDAAEDADTLPNFFGTSAAAPHVAAVAALMLEAAGGPGTLTPARVYGALKSTAIDILQRDLSPAQNAPIGTGYDFWSGHGLVDGVAAIQAVTLPALPTVSIGDVRLKEGNTGQKNFDFTVTLSAASAATTSVTFATFGITAFAGSDYVATVGTLQFSPGDLVKTISVPVIGDTVIEATETFLVVISNPDGLELGDDLGTGTILNDDTGVVAPQVAVRINDVSQNEGDSGSRSFVFTLSLSAASTEEVSISATTADGFATAGSDYLAKT